MASMLRNLPCLLVLSSALVSAEYAEKAPARVSTTIKFEYKLDASNIPRYGSVQTVVDAIDSVMIDKMHEKLSPLESEQLGDAVLEHVKSEIYSQCFAKNDECVMARSLLTLSHNGEKSERFIQLAALRLVDEFLKGFNTRYEDVETTYMFPKVIQTVVEFDVFGINIHLNPDNVDIFRDAMMEVFGDALMSKQRDMDILDVQYIYQERKGTGLQAHLMISGICRSCTERSFKYMLETVFDSSKDDFLAKLRENALSEGASEFSGVTAADYSWPEEPEFLDSLDETVFVADVSEEVAIKEIPWWAIWIGIGCFLVSLGFGILLFSRDDLLALDRDKTNKSYTSDGTAKSQSSFEEVEIEMDGISPDGPGSVADSDDATTYSI